MTRIAVMQPYFVPYAGYFRLFAATDAFVILDTVQFPRRGWVHRNRLRDRTGELSWLTLPLEKGPREMLIREMGFPPDAQERVDGQLRRFPIFERPEVGSHPLVRLLKELPDSPLDLIESLLKVCCSELDLHFDVLRASTLEGLEGFRRTELIMAIAERMGATEYVNLPGGRLLYEKTEFRSRGMELRILGDYQGPYDSILGRLLTERPEEIRAEILGSP